MSSRASKAVGAGALLVTLVIAPRVSAQSEWVWDAEPSFTPPSVTGSFPPVSAQRGSTVPAGIPPAARSEWVWNAEPSFAPPSVTGSFPPRAGNPFVSTFTLKELKSNTKGYVIEEPHFDPIPVGVPPPPRPPRPGPMGTGAGTSSGGSGTGGGTVVTFTPQLVNAAAVGILLLPPKLPKRPDGDQCTAWLVADDLVVTNHHCVSSQAEAEKAQIVFEYVDGTDLAGLPAYACDEWVAAWSSIDAAVLRCKARQGVLPGKVYGKLVLAAVDPAESDPVYIIQHPCARKDGGACEPTKKSSPGKVLKADFEGSGSGFTHTVDTLGGSSGSPVFAARGAQKHQVVGFHQRGCRNESNCDDPAPDQQGVFNIAGRASELRTKLKTLAGWPFAEVVAPVVASGGAGGSSMRGAPTVVVPSSHAATPAGGARL